MCMDASVLLLEGSPPREDKDKPGKRRISVGFTDEEHTQLEQASKDRNFKVQNNPSDNYNF